MRVIDADALKRRVQKVATQAWKMNLTSKIETTLKQFIDYIDEAPSAEQERKTGKWIFKNDLRQFFCSECGFPSLTYDDVYIYSMDLPNFCEDCGADMRGEDIV